MHIPPLPRAALNFELDTPTIIVLAVIGLILFCAVFFPWLHDFRRELRYINMEINRTTGREQAHWKKKKKRLLLSLLPFFHY